MIQLITNQSLSLESAKQLADAAVEKATALGLRVHAVVCDHTGAVLTYQRMPGAPLPAREISEKKARTAANYKLPTDIWAAKVAAKPNVANGLAHHPDIALIGGGVPVLVEGVVVGAIGVAGALEEQDILIARHAVDQLRADARR